jgi:AmpE protein
LLGLAGLLFAIAVLFYTWGPRDLDLDVEAVIEAADPLARRDAVARLSPDGEPAALAGGRLVDAVFRSALRRWFGVLFWFLLLGPFGALMYRLTALSAYGEISRALPPETASGARRWLAVLEWPVAQLMTLALAIVGNFDTVLGAWRDNGGNALDLDSRFLEAVGRASVRTELAEDAAEYVDDGNEQAALAMTGDLPELRDAMSLIWRTLLAWLALLALFVIAGFVN